MFWRRKVCKSRAQFDTALQASVFDDQQAFLAALMDEQTLTQLEQLKQNLENQRRQAQTLVTQTAETLAQHQQHRPDGLALTVTVEQIQQELAQTHQKLRENTTSQGEIRQQLKQDADNRQQQQTLMQQIAQMTQQVEDWGYLNSLIGSKEGDKFRKFARGLTLDNLVHLANQQLTRLHGRYLLQRKASEALEVEVVDTGRQMRYAIPVPFPAAKVSSLVWRWRWRFRIWSAIKHVLTRCSLMKVLARWIAKRWIPPLMRWMP